MATVTKLKLTIRTGSEPFSGTDASIYLALGGCRTRQLYRLPTKPRNLETGQLDVFVADLPGGPDLADLGSILLINGMNGASPAWRVLWIRIEAVDTTGVTWLLADTMLERWLDNEPGRAPAAFIPLKTPFEKRADTDALGLPTCDLEPVA